jgi:hypothetical protein
MLDPIPAYLDCPDCGTSIPVDKVELHACDDRHRRDHLERMTSAAVAELEADIRSFLQTPQGRFELFYAQRTRQRSQ